MTDKTVISVDTAGGDRGAQAILAGLARSARANSDIRYILHGDADELNAGLRRRGALRSICEIRHADKIVAMDDKPSAVLRNSRGTTMLSAIEAVADVVADRLRQRWDQPGEHHGPWRGAGSLEDGNGR